MIRPTQRGVLLFVLGLPLAALPALVDPRLWPVWLTFALGAVALGTVDALLVPTRRACRLAVDAPSLLYIGSGGELGLDVAFERWKRPVLLELLVELDDNLRRVPSEHLRLEPADSQAGARLSLPLVPARRGTSLVRSVWVRARSTLGLLERTWEERVDRSIPITPDVGAVRGVALRLAGPRSALSGIKAERYIGDGSEFESLRRFVPGFDSRAIDWRASARHRSLLCRLHRAERNHQVVLAFDTGRLLSEPLEGCPRLDHAINAGLILGYVCLRSGDRVGLYGFDTRPGTFLPPQQGAQAFPMLQRAAAGLEYSSEETNFTLALSELGVRLPRRSLVVVFTEFSDATSAELMVANLARLGVRHQVLFVALRDPELVELADRRPDSLSDVNRAVVAADLLRERRVVLRRLRQAGAWCIDAEAREVSTELLNRYLEIKRRELV